MTPIEIAFLVFDIIFVVIAIFLIKFLKNASCTLQKATLTAEAVQKQLDDLGDKPKEFLCRANEITADLQNKMKCADPLFRALSNVGERLECKSLAYKEQVFCRCCQAKLQCKDTVQASTTAQYIHLAMAALELWQDLKKRR